MTPNNGLIPYQPNTPLWSDAALKTRYLAVPNNGGVITPDAQIAFAPTGAWTFPAGTVFVKTFELNTDLTNPSVRHRLETRLLVRDFNAQVYGVTYKWRPDNSEADLLTTSLSENILITNATGLSTQTWYYPSPADCLTCHTPVANYVLGLNTRQLNGNQTYPATGVTDNQIRTLNRLGLLNPAIDEAAIASYQKLSPLTNAAASLEERARSYLDANCAQCHQPGGTGITFDARYNTPLANQNITNFPASFSLGYDNACIVKSKDVWRSVLYDRMNMVDSSNAPAKIQMPPLARNLIDTNAIAVMAAWINSLPGTPALAPPIITPNGGNFIASVNVMVQPPDTNATIYYTLDGSLPTTNSLRYSGPINLFSSATISANAFETGYNNSVAASALFLVQPVYFTSERFSNNVFQLGFYGAAGSNYVLQATTNFINWTPLSTNMATSNQFNFSDVKATNFPYRFYRVLQQ
jgi:cytochrome c553